MATILKPLPQGTYIELVKSLFSTRFTTLIMAVSFLGTGLVVHAQSHDSVLDILVAAGSLAAAWRLAVLIIYRPQSRNEDLTLAGARKLERIFAAPYLLFAAIFGAFSARALGVAAPDTHVLIVALLVGYAAGVAAGISYRLKISVTAIFVAVVPTILVVAASGNPTNWAVAAVLALFLGGAVHSMTARFYYAADGINMRLLFEQLARSDALTGLPNRLALSERFAAVAATRTSLAVHCLDLDRFKPVNDRFGHPTGDALLRAVSQRLSGLLRQGDFAARTGGDEFVVIQSVLPDPAEAKLLAERIRLSLAAPYRMNGRSLEVGTSVGYALSSDQGYDLERLIACADTALLEAKTSGGGVCAFHEPVVQGFRLAG